MSRIACVLLVFFSVLLTLNKGFSQGELRISYEFKNQELIQAIQNLEKKYSLIFAYDRISLKNTIIKNVKVINGNLETAIKNLLGPHPFDFEIVNERYIIIKKLESSTFGAPNSQESITPLPSICGTIGDSLTGDHLPFANILIANTTKGVSSDKNGFFRLYGPFQAKDSIEISYIGYEVRRLPIQQLLGNDCATIELGYQQFTIRNVLIKDRAIDLLRAANNGNGIQFTPDQMGMLPGWGDNDVLRMTQLLPGVHSTDDSASNLHIRGGTPDQNLILWDGIPIYHIGHFFGLFSAFNPHIVKNVDVYRGGFGAKYGTRAAGIIDINSKPENLDSLEFGAGMNLISAHAYAKFPLKKGRSALMFAARRSFAEVIKSGTYRKLFDQIAGNGKIQDQRDASQEDENIQLNTDFYFSDVNLKWIFQPGVRDRVTISYYLGSDALDYGLRYDQDWLYLKSNDIIDLRNVGISAIWERKWSERSTSNFSFINTQFENEYQFDITLDREVEKMASMNRYNRMIDFNLRYDHSLKVSSGQYFNFGYHGSTNKVQFDWSATFTESGETNGDTVSIRGEINTFYVDYDYQQPGKLDLDFGIRLTYFSQIEKPIWEPRFAIDYQPFEKIPFHLKGSIGRNAQIVRQILNNNDLGLGERIWVMAHQEDGRNFPVLFSSQAAIGFWLEKKGWLIDGEFYRNRQSNLTSLNQRVLDGKPYSGGISTARGFDLLIKKKWLNYSSWFSYSLGNVNYHFENINENQAFSADHDQLHTINWTHLFKLKNWELSFSWNYGSGRPFTEGIDTETSFSSEENKYQHEVIYGKINSKRLPAYHRLDASLNYNFATSGGVTGKAGVSVFNLYNRKNIANREYFAAAVSEQGQEEARLIQYNRYLLGVMPNFFLQLTW